jgi:hypothetical protein
MKRMAIVIILSGSLWTPAAHAAAAAQPDPSNVRVTIDYRAAPAADVIAALAAAAGVPLELGTGALRPVTITLTNVRLRTAIDAVCDNALCSWLMTGTLRVTPLPSEKSAALPQHVSFTLHDTPVGDVFRALAAAIDVPVTIESDLPSGPVSFSFKNAPTPEVLNMLCGMAQCAWDFDPDRGLRVMRKR